VAVDRSLRRGRASERLVTRDEAFRVLRANLMVAVSDLPNPSVIVTSALVGEGKSSTCAALAQSIAEAGPVVIAIDLDLRHPDLHNRFGTGNERGVSDVLARGAPVDECLQVVRVAGNNDVFFLPAGPPVDNPAELLASPRTGRMLEALSEKAAIVLIDTPPVLPVADTLVVGRYAAGALLVVETGRVPLPAVLKAKAALTRNQTRLLGTVLNRFEGRGSIDALGYGYGYGVPRPEDDAATGSNGDGPASSR
jgi:capsular exopolysaccharide synthesis family protein